MVVCVTNRDTVGLVKRESSQEFGMIQEELDSRLQELEKTHQASLSELGQGLIVNEKKLQEKYHEPVSLFYSCICCILLSMLHLLHTHMY